MAEQVMAYFILLGGIVNVIGIFLNFNHPDKHVDFLVSVAGAAIHLGLFIWWFNT